MAVVVVAVAALKAVVAREVVQAAEAVVDQDKAMQAGGPARLGIHQAVVAVTRPLAVVALAEISSLFARLQLLSLAFPEGGRAGVVWLVGKPASAWSIASC